MVSLINLPFNKIKLYILKLIIVDVICIIQRARLLLVSNLVQRKFIRLTPPIIDFIKIQS